jgi:predicted SnoaL-like aldol condensation-catalyzing enzyme
MHRHTLHALLAATAIVVAHGVDQPASSAQSTANRKQQVIDLLKSIETGAPGPVAVINPKKYIQHNLAAADGLAGFGELMKQLPKGSAKANTRRVLQDGDFVIAHTEYDFFGPKIGFDIFRFEGNLIVEHWDNLQTTAPPNRAGRSMIDGPTEIVDQGRTADNKELVRSFVDDFFINRRPEKIDQYFDGNRYLQHNPGLGDGNDFFRAPRVAGQPAMLTFERVHAVFGEGNFVLTVAEGTFRGQASSFYDLYRVENGKIAEHWDTIEAIPPRAGWKNQNGKFGFPANAGAR